MFGGRGVLGSESTYCNKKAAPQRSGPDFRARTCQRLVASREFDGADRDLAGALVFLGVKRDLLTFLQGAHTSPLKSSRMDEHVLAAVIRLNEPVAFLVVVEFNCSDLHDSS